MVKEDKCEIGYFKKIKCFLEIYIEGDEFFLMIKSEFFLKFFSLIV